MTDDREASGRPIFLGERPMLVWDYDHEETQRSFLASIDPNYFLYQCTVHGEQLAGENKVTAAVALRSTYSHALETLFALVCASIQAPMCPAGWMLRYRVVDLESLVGKISRSEPTTTRMGKKEISWADVAKFLLPWSTPQTEVQTTIEATERVLSALAKQFEDELLASEYNSVKHGLRVRSGASFFAIGREEVPGIAAPAENMRMFAQSDYGSIFYRSVQIKKYQITLEHANLHWDPEDFLKRIPLAVACMKNSLAFLKYANGAAVEDCPIVLFGEQEVADALASQASGFRFTLRTGLGPDHVDDMTSAEIERYYFGQDQADAEPN